MSRDIQVSTNSPAAADFWTQGGSATLAQLTPPPTQTVQAPVGPPKSPMKKVHRLLRGRYPLAIVLAAAGAVAGATAGYVSVPPKFESTGMVQINPLLNTGGSQPGMMPVIEKFAQVEFGLMSSSPVAAKALADPEFTKAWKEAYGTTPLPTESEFLKNVDLPHSKVDGLIKASFDDRNKAVAKAGAQSLFRAYMSLHGDTEEFYQTKKVLDDNIDLRDRLNGEIEAQETQLQGMAKSFGISGLAARSDYLNTELNRLDGELKTTQRAYQDALEAQQNHTVKPVDRETIYLEILELPDRMMTEYYTARENARTNLKKVAVNYGTNHPVYADAERQVKEAEKRVDDYATQFIAINGTRIPTINNGDVVAVNNLKKNVAALTEQFNSVKAEAGEIDKEREEIAKVRNKIAEITVRRDKAEETINQINRTQKLTRTVILIDPGGEAVVDDNKRKLAAGVGMMFGGLIPFGLLMLYGLTENRFRYSDDANSTDLAGVTLLGILPNLPDRLSDPQQAGVAAHCVHQIRTMLQISRSNDEPQVIAVTSAAPGDGKTSLTLALGLSYAACGARTLLVDCDLVAAGLTHRLNVSSPDGVLEAVANRALLEYVRTTDIADVAILPVGTTHAHHASTLSPVALRRLLSEAKKQFDIIIVDTGPILGSIEASLVCAAADRTILTVARNQQRPLVERSISHLQSIGANLAGVVFNRAQARDFEKSMNGLALRSRPPAPSGATAKAVAGSFKRAG